MFRFILLSTIILLAGVASVARADEKVAAQTAPATQATHLPGVRKVVGLDYYYNHQIRGGKQVGYTWENTDADGYSKFGEIWKSSGATLAKLEKAPTRQDLDRFSVYIFVSPCNESTAANHHPNYIESDAIETITSWVHDGGLLLLFANSRENCDFTRINLLANRFSLAFRPDRLSTVPDSVEIHDQKVKAKVLFSAATDDPDYIHLLKDVDPDSIYIREFSPILAYDSPAKTLLSGSYYYSISRTRSWHEFLWDWLPWNGHPIVRLGGKGGVPIPIIAVSQIGKGMVLAVGSPWFMNEFLSHNQDGKTNGDLRAANNLATWFLSYRL